MVSKKRNRRRIILTGFMVVLALTFSFIICSQNFICLPPHINVIEGQKQNVNLKFPLSLNVEADRSDILNLNGKSLAKSSKISFADPVDVKPTEKGKVNLKFKLFGIIPVRHMVVDVIPPLEVIPGGQSIGVLLHPEGVVVVGYATVISQDGKRYHPAEDIGIQVGDVITKIEGQPIQGNIQMAEIINAQGKKGKKVLLEIEREKQKIIKEIMPRMCDETGRYRIGLFVREEAGGVGTLTFYEPKSGAYGALGHAIVDPQTSEKINISNARVIKAQVSRINQGKAGLPGEKIGLFVKESKDLGNIESNTEYGIFGSMNPPAGYFAYETSIPVGLMNEVEEGPAEILTVIQGQTVQKFEIQIEKIKMQKTPTQKGMVIKVVDPELLKRTGGIVQGMSGSPIIQNGKIIGAVTHVFVNDPTKGYGIFIEWMLQEADLMGKNISRSPEELSLDNSFFYLKE